MSAKIEKHFEEIETGMNEALKFVAKTFHQRPLNEILGAAIVFEKFSQTVKHAAKNVCNTAKKHMFDEYWQELREFADSQISEVFVVYSKKLIDDGGKSNDRY